MEAKPIGASTRPQPGQFGRRRFHIQIASIATPLLLLQPRGPGRAHISSPDFWPYRFLSMASLLTPNRRVLLVGDHKIGRSTLAAVRMADKPFLDSPPPYPWGPSFVQSVTGLDLEKLTTSNKRVIQNIRDTQLHIFHVTDCADFAYRRCLYKYTTAVVFCFSIGDESSFENIKHKVN